MFVNYLGFFMTGCCMIAVGLFISTQTESQVTAAIATFGAILLIYLMDSIVSVISINFIGVVLEWLSLFSRFSDFTNGILNISSTIYMITFSAVFLFLTVASVEKRRWSEG